MNDLQEERLNDLQEERSNDLQEEESFDDLQEEEILSCPQEKEVFGDTREEGEVLDNYQENDDGLYSFPISPDLQENSTSDDIQKEPQIRNYHNQPRDYPTAEHHRPLFLPKHLRFCDYCKKPGHTVDFCFALGNFQKFRKIEDFQ